MQCATCSQSASLRFRGQSRGQVPGSGMSRALFGHNFRIRNRRNEAAERRPINFKFFNGVGVFSGLGVDYEYRDGA